MQQTTDSSVVEDSNQPPYDAVEIPTKPPTEFTYVERRADILQQIYDVGHPSALNQTELAERYGVSQQQISKDFDRLDEYLRESISGRRDLTIRPVYERAITGLLENEEYYKAAQVTKMLDDYLAARIDTLEFRHRLDQLEDAKEQDDDIHG